jgi:hypothetical protein
MNRDDATGVARGIVDHPYRRIVLAHLDSEEEPVSVETLAHAVIAYDLLASNVADGIAPALDGGRIDPPHSMLAAMIAQLHHAHLPRLMALGLLSYDGEDGVVTEWRHPRVGDRWLTSPPIDALAAVIADVRTATHHASDRD